MRVSGDEARYLSTVLRIRKGEGIEVAGEGGRRVMAEVVSVRKAEVELLLSEELPSRPEPSTGIVLAQGVLKGAKMDLVVQKATELGVMGIVPVITERGQVRQTRKSERWRKIALEAARQCGRSALPEISEPLGLGEFLEASLLPGIVFYEQEPEALGNAPIDLSSGLVLLVGPEGGLSRQEVDMALEHGYKSRGLGANILRAETASIAAVALIQFLSGRLS